MAKHFSYASEPHPVWAPLAAKIHEAVWDDVGLEKVQGFVRQWAEEFNQRQAEVKEAQEDWRKKAMKRAKKVNERFNQHHLAQAKLLENNPKHLCQPCPIKMVDTPCPPDLELPLPPPHRTLSKLEQWADLAAIHDYYGTGEKVNLWPLEQCDGPLPTNKLDRNRHLEELRKQAVGDHYWHLIEEAGRLAEGHKPFIERCLKDVAASKLSGSKEPKTNGQADSITDNKKKTQPDNVDVADLCRLLQREIPKSKHQIDIALEFTRNDKHKAENLLRQARRYRHLWPSSQKRTKSGQGG